MARVLVIDDDPDLLNVCRIALGAMGHAVSTAGTAEEGLVETAVSNPEVIVLDLGLPDLDGMDLCRRIRSFSAVPVVVLSADGSEDRKVEALDGGADDYVTKPFGMRELDARIKVAVRHRRTMPRQELELSVGQLRIDLVHREAELAGEPLDLTPKEFDFLAYLGQHAGKVCTRKMILENVWGPAYASESQYLKVYAYRLRRKLHDEGGQLLQSDPAVGYRLAVTE